MNGSVAARAGGKAYPGKEWTEASASDLGWSPPGLAELSRELSSGGSTALMVLSDGRIVFSWGDLAQKSSIASVRKSIVNVLFGVAVGQGEMRLDATLADLDIDDVVKLTRVERGATVEHLLEAKSGVYHPSVYDTARERPARGTHAPGTFWFYNNWDFNVLGTIFERATGRSIFEAIASDIAVPIEMEDFVAEDGHYHHGSESKHPVYKLQFSARDLARVGLLYLRNGRWRETQIVSQAWVRDSVHPHSDIGGGRGYGYLWWTAEANAPGDSLSCDEPIFYASGYGGQYVIVLPTIELVIVHRSARVDKGITHQRMGEILRRIISAAPFVRRDTSEADPEPRHRSRA